MGKSADFAVYDPVELNLGGTSDFLGHIARKEANEAVVVTGERRQSVCPVAVPVARQAGPQEARDGGSRPGESAVSPR